MNLIIAGSRDFNNYSLLCAQVKAFLDILKPEKGSVVIISGGARGADALGERLAQRNTGKVGLKVMKADWNQGRGAGYRRNERMLAIADAAIIFCVGGSHGSTHMRDIAVSKGIPTAFVSIEGGRHTVSYSGLEA